MTRTFRVSQVRLSLKHTDEDIFRALTKKLSLSEKDIVSYEILKLSLDARKKNDIHYSLTAAVTVDEKAGDRLINAKRKSPDILLHDENKYEIPSNGGRALKERPVIVGSGPAGLFAAYLLAKRGLKPLIIERGSDAERRTEKVEHFFATNELDDHTNVQFGEGGAGTFSDGKLNTMVKDPYGRIRFMLETFASFGADESITYINKPHIGTDVLKTILINMRHEIENLGGTYRFDTAMTDIRIEDGHVTGITVNENEEIPCEVLVLAPGHSARDTFGMLLKRGFVMSQKEFAVGLRVEHPQELVSRHQYGDKWDELPPADYKVTYRASNGRGVYSFCMCPGGYVVNSSSEKGLLLVNGMSYHARDGINANSAIIVTVGKDDFDGNDALAGVRYQEGLERKAYKLANGKIPVQLYGDYKAGRISSEYKSVKPAFKGQYAFADMSGLFSKDVGAAFIEGMEAFGRKIEGFNMPDVILAGVESRTSSPVRIERDKESLEALSVAGVYPSGEGAGYAGGITSAAVDGMKVAEKIIEKYRPL